MRNETGQWSTHFMNDVTYYRTFSNLIRTLFTVLEG